MHRITLPSIQWETYSMLWELYYFCFHGNIQECIGFFDWYCICMRQKMSCISDSHNIKCRQRREKAIIAWYEMGMSAFLSFLVLAWAYTFRRIWGSDWYLCWQRAIQFNSALNRLNLFSLRAFAIKVFYPSSSASWACYRALCGSAHHTHKRIVFIYRPTFLIAWAHEQNILQSAPTLTFLRLCY